uniref:Uncharacterized protein n=1 Tax=Glossina pallidipes TaxID=7398 RepID=A0A1A9ZPR6_GLOPL
MLKNVNANNIILVFEGCHKDVITIDKPTTSVQIAVIDVLHCTQFVDKEDETRTWKPNPQGDATLESANKIEDVVMSQDSSDTNSEPTEDKDVS